MITDPKEKLALIKRNTAEVVTERELETLVRTVEKPVVYCGYEPSGPVHLGHMVTISKLIDFENAGFKVKILMADWHAWLNRKGDWDFIRNAAKEWEKAFKRLGLKNAEYILGSSFQMKEEYITDVFELAEEISVSRALRSMQTVARESENAKASQMIYPLMQIADIKHLKVDAVEAGIEQRKIYMLAREHISRIGYKKLPYVYTPLINSLLGPGDKMSSSIPNSMISTEDDAASIKDKIKKAYCKEKELDGNPILEIARYVVMPRTKELIIPRPKKYGGKLIFTSQEEIERSFRAGELHPMDLKTAVAEHLIKILKK
ncbi:MAG: tyrosine--tRNA ligase [Candidatus Diapherotrites archaeon]